MASKVRKYKKRNLTEDKAIIADKALGMSNVAIGKKYDRSTSTIRKIIEENQDLMPREEIAEIVKKSILENTQSVSENVDNIISKGMKFYSNLIDEITDPANKAPRGELDVLMRIMQEAIRYQGKLLDNTIKLNIHNDNLGFKNKELDASSDNNEELVELMKDISEFGKRK